MFYKFVTCAQSRLKDWITTSKNSYHFQENLTTLYDMDFFNKENIILLKRFII